jgi:hypothetical protein
MKQFTSIWIFALALIMSLTSCELVGGIFKAGFWTAIILIVIVVVVIIWVVNRFRGR